MLADIRGVSINYEISGNEGGPWLTFSNSLATNLHMWDEQEAALADDFHILRYDKRGHGRSAPVEGPYTFDDLVGDVVGLWDHLGISKSHFVGLSIGGMTAQGLLLNHADRVTATVMANTSAHSGEAFIAAFDQRVAAVAEGGMEAVVESTIERWFSEGLPGGRCSADRRRAAHDPHDLGRRIHGLRARHSVARESRPAGRARPSRPADRGLAGPRHAAGRHAPDA